MKFEYKIIKADKSSEILRAMSFKKVLKQINWIETLGIV